MDDKVSTVVVNTSFNSLTSGQDQQYVSGELSDFLLQPIQFVTAAIALFGLASNVVNLLVFYKLGFYNPSNVSFFALTVADFLFVSCVFLTVIQKYLERFSLLDVIVVAVLPQIIYAASAIGSWVTTLITLEKCCCVVFPLKTKKMFNSRLVVILLLLMVTYEVATSTPYHFAFKIIHTSRSPGSNLTHFVVDTAQDKCELISLIRLISFSIPTIVCFILVLFGSLVLINTLNNSNKRDQAMTNQTTEDMSSRDARIIKSVVYVCSIYMFGYFLDVVKIIVSPVVPKLNVFDPHLGNLTHLLMKTSLLFQTISCSVNIFVYIRMNNHFKLGFQKLLICLKKRVLQVSHSST